MADDKKVVKKAPPKKAAAKKTSVDQLLTLASLIQAESADEADMYNVSSGSGLGLLDA